MNQANTIRFMYLRAVSHSLHVDLKTQKPFIHTTKTPVACIGIAVDEASQEIFYTVSSVNPLDNYDKTIARHVCTERMKKNPYVLPLNGVIRRYTISGMVMQDIVDHVVDDIARFDPDVDGPGAPQIEFSQSTFKAARLWLRANPHYATQDQVLPSSRALELEGADVATVPVDESKVAELAYNTAE